MEGNLALTEENVYLSVNPCCVNDRLCMFNILDPCLPCIQCMLNSCPCQYSSPPTDKTTGTCTTLNSFFGSSLMKINLTYNLFENELLSKKLTKKLIILAFSLV